MFSLKKYEIEQNTEATAEEAAHFMSNWGIDITIVQPLELRQVLLNYERTSASQAIMNALLTLQQEQNPITE